MTNIYRIFFGRYSTKYGITYDNKLRISIPDYIQIISKDSKYFSVEMVEHLQKTGWTKEGIDGLEKYILFPKNGIYINFLRIDPKTGVII